MCLTFVDQISGQIFVNLLSNSCKFSSKGDIILQARLVTTELDFCRIEFSVKDEGIGIKKKISQKIEKFQGIPESAKNNIFQPFYQAEDGINRKFGGSGLGLAISKRIAELHGGTMWFHSVQNQGTTFFFSIQVPFHISAVAKAPSNYAKVFLLVPEKNQEYLKILRFKFLFLGMILTDVKEEAEIVFIDIREVTSEIIAFFDKSKVKEISWKFR